jgi:hypothetical protein
VGLVLRRIVPVFALLGVLVAGCDSGPGGGTTPPAPGAGPAGTVDPGDGEDSSGSPSPVPTIGVPSDACRLLDEAGIARAAGAATATGKATSQGPFRSCEYTVKMQDGPTGQLFLDVADQRTRQLYDVATSDVPVTELSVGGLKASYDPTNGKVYVLTTRAFFSIQLPTNIGKLTTADGLATAATDLATQVVDRIGG